MAVIIKMMAAGFTKSLSLLKLVTLLLTEISVEIFYKKVTFSDIYCFISIIVIYK